MEMAQKLRRLVHGFCVAVALLAVAGQMPVYAGEKVDVNTATVEQLQEVKGIGAKTAAAIVAYREEHGPFASLDDLVKVRGIGEKKLKQLRDALTIGKADGKAEK